MIEAKERTQVRIPQTLHRWMTARAVRNNRSMNGELVNILQDAKARDEAEQKTQTP